MKVSNGVYKELLTAMKTAGVMAADPEPETDPDEGGDE